MSYKILKIGRYYPASIQQIYVEQPALAHQDYQTQLDALLWQCMSTGDAYTQAFRELGYTGAEIIANADVLQYQWAQEHGVTLDGTDDQKTILLAQIAHFAPEILLVFGGASILTRADMQHIKAQHPHLRTVVFTDAPTSDFSPFFEYDLVISNTPELVTFYAEQGLPIQHVHYGFDPRVCERINMQHKPTVDFGFIGSIITLDGYHQQREQLLATMVTKTKLGIWSPVPRLSRTDCYLNRMKQLAYDAVQVLRKTGLPSGVFNALPGVKKVARWKKRPQLSSRVDWRIARRAQAPQYGLAMFQLLHDTRVSFNHHIDVSANSATNMRLFEATGVQSCLLTDWKDDLPQMYEPDLEVVTYRTPEEAIEKARYLLDNPAERQRIAAAGQQRTLRDHTYEKRVEQLDALFRQHFS